MHLCLTLCSFQPSFKHSESQKKAFPLHDPAYNLREYVFCGASRDLLTAALLPRACATAVEAALPRPGACCTCLLLKVDALEMTARNVQSELPEVTERLAVDVLTAGHELAVDVPAEGKNAPSRGIREQRCLRAVCRVAAGKDVPPRPRTVCGAHKCVCKVREAELLARGCMERWQRRMVPAKEHGQPEL